MDQEQMKTCRNCGTQKPLTEFGNNRSKKSGVDVYCILCSRKIRKRNRARLRNPCSVPGCDNVGYTEKTMCSMHRGRVRKHGDPGPPGKLLKVKKQCKLEKCPRPSYSGGWCRLHYSRVKRTGSPGSLIPTQPRRECLVPRCERRHRSRGLCDMHYRRWHSTGKIGPAEFLKPYPVRKCSENFCDVKYYAKGLCKMHYRRMRYHTVDKPRRRAA